MAFSILRLGVLIKMNFIERTAAVTPALLKKGFAEPFRNMKDICKCAQLLPSASQVQFIPVRHYSKHKHISTQKKPEKKYESDSDYSSSSDSDNEKLGHKGESDFWRRKIRTFHGILDVNNDGVISYDDFKLLGDRFVKLGNLSEKGGNDFQEVIKDLWEVLWGEITPYNLVTLERHLEDMHHVINDKALRRKAHAFLPFLFKALDKDKSGVLTVEEYKHFFECLGLKELDAIFAFRTIDTNGDGKVNKKEFVKNGREFFVTEDEQRISKYFWGPLVED